MAINIAILVAASLGLAALMWPRLRNRAGWRAMATPLASIIGSGFLVLGPILNDSYGASAPLVMAALCLVAYLFGAAIRSNIATLEHRQTRTWFQAGLEDLGSAVLAFAYVISVAYYLNLFGAFAVGLTPFDTPAFARMVTSLALGTILVVGWTRGFAALERMEKFSVSLKLAIILGLLVGLCLFLGGRIAANAVVISAANLSGWPAVTLAFGLIVTVQGFETSRYLGQDYPAGLRIRSMRWAQWASSAIYIVYVCLLVYSLAPDPLNLSETAIIGLMGQVASSLPYLLVAAALAAQFSAAVADTAGAGGLVAEVTGGRITTRLAYALLVTSGLVLTWTFDVFTIIAYASRAFAAYYAIECAIAAQAQWGRSRAMALGFGALAVLAVAITVFGRPVE